MKVEAILFDLTNNAPVVVLKDLEGKRILPIWIGPFEANAIEMELQQVRPPRPMTHDLLKNMLDNLGVQIIKVAICDLHNNTFMATISIEFKGKPIEIDARPSDAIALALRTKTPIFAVEWILKEASLLEEDDEKIKFKKFLENLKPDDFKYKH